MNKLSLLIIPMIFLILVLGACGPSQIELDATATARIATSDAIKGSIRQTQDVAPASATAYRVTNPPGLYSDFDIDADQIASLSVGTILVPPGGSGSVHCDAIVEFGTTYELCRVQVYSTGQIGWVLKKWIKKN